MRHFNVKYNGPKNNRIAVIKALRETFGIGLREAYTKYEDALQFGKSTTIDVMVSSIFSMDSRITFIRDLGFEVTEITQNEMKESVASHHEQREQLVAELMSFKTTDVNAAKLITKVISGIESGLFDTINK